MQRAVRGAAGLCALLACTALCGCDESFAGRKKVRLRGGEISAEYVMDETALVACAENQTYEIVIDGLLMDETQRSHVSVVYAETPYVNAVFDRELLDYGFSVALEPGRIVVSTDYDWIYSAQNFYLETGANYDRLTLGGGYDLYVDAGSIESLSISARDYVDCWVEYLSVDLLHIQLNCEGALYFYNGRAFKVEADVRGSYSVDARRLTTRYCVLDISGYCVSQWSVRDSLRLDFTGGGRVSYYGYPSVTKLLSGPGELIFEDKDVFSD